MTAARGPGTHADPVRVVLLADASDIRLLLRVALEANGQFRVVRDAAAGPPGFEVVRRERPDLVVLDLAAAMPAGVDLVRRIRAELPAAHVVVLASESDRMSERARDAGADAYLLKGSSAKRIVSSICATLGLDEATAAPGRGVASQHGVARPLPANVPPAGAGVDPARTTRAELDRVHAALAGAAHELRGPATVLLAMTELLSTERDAIDESTVSRMLDAIQRQARVLDRVTGDLLTSTQSQRGVLTVDVEAMRLAPLIDGAALGVTDRIDLQLDCDPGIWVRADPTRVQQMLDNLVSNAIKYGAAPIEISAFAREGFAHVRVLDHGSGVPESFRARLFGQFSRAEGARVNGMGLGLFVVRALTEAQGGRAWYEPVPAGGSAFCFTLPLAPARAHIVVPDLS